MGTAMVIALILLVIVTLIVSAATALARPPTPVRRSGADWLARLICPRTGERTAVRIGPDPDAEAPAVLWCERFADGHPACDRECFTALGGEEGPRSMMEPA